jgi:hypothetical protein
MKDSYSVSEFFTIVQGYCDLLADLSLVIKMGRNVKKCTIYLFNIPENAVIPEFMTYDSQGPAKGAIAVVVIRQDHSNDPLICYQVPESIRNEVPQHIIDILVPRKLFFFENALYC